jgi:hypothetical protein
MAAIQTLHLSHHIPFLYVSRWLQFILLLSFLDCLPEDRAQHWWRDSKEMVNKSLVAGRRREMDLTGYKRIDGLYVVALRWMYGRRYCHLYGSIAQWFTLFLCLQ